MKNKCLILANLDTFGTMETIIKEITDFNVIVEFNDITGEESVYISYVDNTNFPWLTKLNNFYS